MTMSHRIIGRLTLRHFVFSVARSKGNNSAYKKIGLSTLFTGPNQRFNKQTLVKKLNIDIGYKSQHSYLCHSKCSSSSSINVTPATKCVEVAYIDTNDKNILAVMCKDMKVIEDFVSEEEEQEILKEIEPYLKRQKYQSSHWDDAIHEYRETERRKWTEKNTVIIQRVRDTAFPPGVPQISLVHVLDLKKEGQIKPHVDSVKFCGNTIAGISLLSSSVMRLVHTEDKTKAADILLKRRSLYIMKNDARYQYTHEILPEAKSFFRDSLVPRDRRISVICRNEPEN